MLQTEKAVMNDDIRRARTGPGRAASKLLDQRVQGAQAGPLGRQADEYCGGEQLHLFQFDPKRSTRPGAGDVIADRSPLRSQDGRGLWAYP